MKTIIIATDFSDTAKNAAQYAIEIAQHLKANLVILHVFQMPINYSELPVVIDFEKMIKAAEQELETLKMELHTSFGSVSIDTQVIVGSFLMELNKVCEKLNPYVVVIGTQGKTATERLFFGSEAVNTIKHLEWPVISVPLSSKYDGIKKIAFACDFEDVQSIPVDSIKSFISDFKAALHVINTGNQSKHSIEVFSESIHLMNLLEEVKPIYHYIESKDVEAGTMRFADSNEMDLLIILPKHHSLVDRLLFNAHTNEFVLHSHIPLLALHPV